MRAAISTAAALINPSMGVVRIRHRPSRLQLTATLQPPARCSSFPDGWKVKFPDFGFWFLVWQCRHTASPPITSETHTSGAQYEGRSPFLADRDPHCITTPHHTCNPIHAARSYLIRVFPLSCPHCTPHSPQITLASSHLF